MDSQWILVIIGWGSILGVIIACLISDARKTPEQREKEAQMARERSKKEKNTPAAPAEGCLPSAIKFIFTNILLILVIIIFILIIAR